ncbi:MULTISPECIES: hypothetical protein [Paraclostridium]|uniref:Uncharacterized protein n=1 Tax=Paraclostridium bifermentans TaxID=1490 RepID=A0A5P3XKH2_PARBF|nr:hypothetical protein [Paraclostridium bifermentans]QEZ70834.1 hypothetical protein D4A35_18030 [Paraclostridium bifermentans]
MKKRLENNKKYTVDISPIQDVDILDSLEEREELQEIINTEIENALSSIENWCKKNKVDFDLIDNHRCSIETKNLIESQELNKLLNSIEKTELDETDLNFECIGKKIILYVANNGKYEVKEVNDLGEGHKLFNKKMIEGNFTYLELGIDKIDIDGEYKIVRNLYK